MRFDIIPPLTNAVYSAVVLNNFMCSAIYNINYIYIYIKIICLKSISPVDYIIDNKIKGEINE